MRKTPPWFFLVLVLTIGALGPACKKVGLREDYGSFALATSYWFEREETAYVFFEVAEAPERLPNSSWVLAYENEPVASRPDDEKGDSFTIDFSQGVHFHETLACGGKRVCGSFSFKTPYPISEMQLKLFYDKDSPLKLDTITAHRNVTTSDQSSSYSALVYGVFDEENQRVQPRIFHNFGSPADADMARFGMVRRFATTVPKFADPTKDAISELATLRDDSALFPATLCPTMSTKTKYQFKTNTPGWVDESYSVNDLSKGVCFAAELLDKEGNLIDRQPAFARRNPRLENPAFTLKTPLTNAVQIPIQLNYCEDNPFASDVIDQEFLAYQKFVLGMKSRDTDVCFEVGKEKAFRTEFASHLGARLAAAKANLSDGLRDFMFVVLFHENLSGEFRKFHQIIAEELTKAINDETGHISPRLAGAFVYAGNTDFKPTLVQAQKIIWCPQELAPELAAKGIAKQNCTNLRTGQLDLGVINFVTPMGPLPSYSSYKDYIRKYGDEGMSRTPRLGFDTVTRSAATRDESNKQVTFFESQKITIDDDQYIRVCFEKEGAFSILPPLRFRTPALVTDDEVSLTIETISAIWLSDKAPGTYDVGLKWDFPFRGGIRYKSVLSGEVLSVAPFRQSFPSFENLGDEIWDRTSWNLGKYLQRCNQYCDHPYFDESGTYQLREKWISFDTQICTNPRYPEPPL